MNSQHIPALIIERKIRLTENKPKQEGETCGFEKETNCGICEDDLRCYHPKPYGCGICRKKTVLIPRGK